MILNNFFTNFNELSYFLKLKKFQNQRVIQFHQKKSMDEEASLHCDFVHHIHNICHSRIWHVMLGGSIIQDIYWLQGVLSGTNGSSLTVFDVVIIMCNALNHHVVTFVGYRITQVETGHQNNLPAAAAAVVIMHFASYSNFPKSLSHDRFLCSFPFVKDILRCCVEFPFFISQFEFSFLEKILIV